MTDPSQLSKPETAKTGKLVTCWFVSTRYAWRNDGGPIPYRLRGQLKRDGKIVKTLRSQSVKRGEWAVFDGHEIWVWRPGAFKRSYRMVRP